jgi:preprotein translocase subunit SecE
VARQTRQQRRARRQAQGDSGASAAPRARARAQQIRPAAQPQKSQTGSRPVPGRETRRFLSESWGELKKVEWPSQGQVIQGTTVVLIACIIVGLYLYANDQVWKRFVEHVLLH